MEKFSHFIVKNRKIFFVIFILLTVLSAIAIIPVYKRVNSDLTSYLPDGTQTKDGQVFLSETFNLNGDCMIGIASDSADSVKAYVEQFSKIDGVSSVMWRGSDMLSLLPALQTLLQDGMSLGNYEIVPADAAAAEEMAANIEMVDKVFFSAGEDEIEGTSDDVYVVLLTLDYGPSTQEAFAVLDEVDEILSKGGASYTIGGMTAMTKGVFDSTVYEVWKYTLVAMIVVIILLIILTDNWAEPIVLLLTLGVSVIINMGTNIILPRTSIITFSSSAVLQLGLSMDYAIFFLHSVKAENKHNHDFNLCVEKAIPKTLKTIFASALTTAGGFLALFFMRFEIGADLGTVLAKGIMISMLTVLFLQPALVVLFRKPIQTWKHKSLNLHFRKPIKYSVKYRTIVVIFMLVTLLPIMILQSKLNYGYLDFIKADNDNPTLAEQMVDTVSNQLVIAVPYDADNIDLQYKFIDKLNILQNPDGSKTVSFILGLNAMMPEAAFKNNFIYTMMTSGNNQKMLSDYLNTDENAGVTYTLYTIGVTTDIEGEDTLNSIEEIENIIKDVFGEEVMYYKTGLAQSAKDFSEITPTDFTRVSLASIIIIFFILLFTFRSIKHSTMLVLLIEFGIWINLALQKIIGTQINFMSYIIISSIQLGSTVDYAILVTGKYRENRKKLMPQHAAYQATTSSVMSVITSAAIMAGACLSVYFVTSNLIVAEITMLIARGSIISLLLVLFVLPALLSYMDRPLPEIDTWKLKQRKKLSKRIKSNRAKKFTNFFGDRLRHGLEDEDTIPDD